MLKEKTRDEFLQEKFLDPLTDFGFKKLFKGAENKRVLIDFLNTVLEPYNEYIVDIEYDDPEQLGEQEKERKAVCDLVCTNSEGTTFLVEVQRAYQEYFVDRSLYYISHFIQKQGKRGDWDYQLKRVYSINLLDFECREPWSSEADYRSDFQLREQRRGEGVIDTITSIYYELPKFQKRLEEVETKEDKWLYYVTGVSELEEEVVEEDEILLMFMHTAKISNLSKKELSMYRKNQKAAWDAYATLKSAKKIGEKEGEQRGYAEGKAAGLTQGLSDGKAEGIKEVGKAMLEKGIDFKTVLEVTGLSEQELKSF